MSPSHPAGALKVRVPRQNAQRLGPAVTAEVKTLAREQGINVQLPPPVQEQPSAAGPSSESASEWNSMLATARAERGPQWDVGTQQFLVEKESELYYDPTPLLEAARASKAENEREDAVTQRGGSIHQQQQDFMMSSAPQQYRNPYQNPNMNVNMYPSQQQFTAQYGGNTMQGSPGPPTRSGHGGFPAHSAQGYNSAVPPGQYFGDATRGNMVDGMNAAPRRVTRGMAEEFPGMYGN